MSCTFRRFLRKIKRTFHTIGIFLSNLRMRLTVKREIARVFLRDLSRDGPLTWDARIYKCIACEWNLHICKLNAHVRLIFLIQRSGSACSSRE